MKRTVSALKRLLLAVMLLLFLVPSIPRASALSCAINPSVEEAYKAYDGIVLAHVDHAARGQIDITVTKSFKGVRAAHLTLQEDVTWGAIDGPSVAGEDYLFYLKKEGSNWSNPLCAPSRKADAATKDLKFLEGKEIKLREPAALLKLNDGETGTVNWLVLASAALFLVVIVAIGAAVYRKRSRK